MTPTASIRRFNRAYTRVLGLLDDDFLERGRTLGASRMLFEIGERDRSVAELRDRLGLDSGYTSRLLRSLEADGLVSTSTDPTDRRRRVARLTPAGRRERALLDDLSDRHVDGLLAPLDERRRDALADALDTARRLVLAASIRFVEIEADDRAATRALERYFDELDARFVDGFDPGAGAPVRAAGESALARFVVAVIPDPDPDAGLAAGSVEDRGVVGCGAVSPLGDGVAEIKRMWVDPAWRGLGLAPRMLAHLEMLARTDLHHTIVLDTNDVLTEAIAMYRSHGYTEIEPYNENPYARLWFSKPIPPER